MTQAETKHTPAPRAAKFASQAQEAPGDARLITLVTMYRTRAAMVGDQEQVCAKMAKEYDAFRGAPPEALRIRASDAALPKLFPPSKTGNEDRHRPGYYDVAAILRLDGWHPYGVIYKGDGKFGHEEIATATFARINEIRGAHKDWVAGADLAMERSGLKAAETVFDTLQIGLCDLEREIAETPADTLGGVGLKLSVIRRLVGEISFEAMKDNGDIAEDLAFSIVADLARLMPAAN